MDYATGIEGGMIGLVTARAEGRIAGAMARRASSMERASEPFGLGAGDGLRRAALDLHHRASGRVIDAAGSIVRFGLDVVG